MPKCPDSVIVCATGMVMAFDKAGEQISEYQGRITEVLEKILRHTEGTDCRFEIGSWGKGMMECSRGELQILADTIKR